MKSHAALLAIAALTAGGASAGDSQDEQRSQVQTVASDSGYATKAAEEHQTEERLRDVARGHEGSDDPGIATIGFVGHTSSTSTTADVSPSGDQFEPIAVCVFTDEGPDVVTLPGCDDLVRPVEGEDGGEDGQESVGDEAGPVIITVTRSDFAELPLALPVVHLQPEREWFLVNMELLVFTDGDEQLLDTTVLGVPVRVRARPVEFSWDFGDGSEPVVTTGPGGPWPATDIGHVYSREAQGVVVTLTTTWSGEFQVAGQGPWIPIAGTTSTQSQSAPFRLEAVQTRLTANH